jgi:hypothetical protein
MGQGMGRQQRALQVDEGHQHGCGSFRSRWDPWGFEMGNIGLGGEKRRLAVRRKRQTPTHHPHPAGTVYWWIGVLLI